MNSERRYSIEGHSKSTLGRWGGNKPHPFMTRREAWDILRKLIADTKKGEVYPHSTFVIRCGADIVFRAVRQPDGTYIDLKTAGSISPTYL